MKDERIYIRVTSEEKAKLEELAKEEGRTVSGLVRYLAKLYIDKKIGCD